MFQKRKGKGKGGKGGLYANFWNTKTRSKRLWVGNLSFWTSWKGLKDHFNDMGNVVFAKVSEDWNNTTPSGRPIRQGWGIVEFSTVQEAQSALNKLNNTILDERPIHVREDRDDKDLFGKGKGK